MQKHVRQVTEAQMPSWDAGLPQVRAGGSPPKFPPDQILKVAQPPEPKRSVLQTLSLYGCLLQLVALFAALWIITGIIALIAILS